MGHGLRQSEALERHLACTLPELDRDLVVARRGVVPRELLGRGLGDLRPSLLQRPRDRAVQLLAAAAQQRVVRDVVDERVLEREHRVGRRSLLEGQTRCAEPLHELGELGCREGRHGCEQLEAELAAHDRADLGDLLRGAETVETRHQRVAERVGNRGVPGRADEGVAPVLDCERARLEQRLRHLLGEQGHPVRLLDDRLEQVVG